MDHRDDDSEFSPSDEGGVEEVKFSCTQHHQEGTGAPDKRGRGGVNIRELCRLGETKLFLRAKGPECRRRKGSSRTQIDRERYGGLIKIINKLW